MDACVDARIHECMSAYSGGRVSIIDSMEFAGGSKESEEGGYGYMDGVRGGDRQEGGEARMARPVTKAWMLQMGKLLGTGNS
jgi:hypothetical protein